MLFLLFFCDNYHEISAAPTFSRQAPSIYKLSYEAASSSIVLSVEFESAGVYGGVVYCAAFVDGTTVSSVGKVKSAGTAVSYSTGTTALTVTVEGLAPLTAYSAYCYVENVLGIGSSLTEVRDTQTAVRTACCKTIEFTNAPTRVYGDPTTYTSQQRNQYTFIYTLNSAPSEELTVSLKIFALNFSNEAAGAGAVIRTINWGVPNAVHGVSSDDVEVEVSPATRVFYSAGSGSSGSQQQGSGATLTGNFILRAANEFVEGDYAVYVELGGASSAQFAVGSSDTNTSASEFFLPVSILSTASAPPSPMLSRCQFSSTGASAYIFFDSPTNRAGLQSARWNCAEVFQFVSATTSVCSWVNNSAVQVVFDYSSTSTGSGPQSIELLQVGDSVSLKPAVIKAACPNGIAVSTCASTFDTSPAQSVTAAAPANPVVPSVVISVPSVTVGSCSNVSVDASQSTGSGGRDWGSVVWVVSASQQDISSVQHMQSILDAGGTAQTQQYELPSALLVPGATYSLSLSLTNFLGKLSSSSATFSIAVNNPNTPSVKISGGSRRVVQANQVLVLYSSASRASCAEDSSSALQFTWRLRNEGNEDEDFYRVTSTSSNPTILKLAPYTLSAGQVYEVQVTVTASATATYPSAESSATVEVFVESGDLVAVVEGGSSIFAPIEDTLTLDASGSYDADTGTSEGLTFLWTCTLTNAANFGEPCASSVLENTTVSSSLLVVNGPSLPVAPVEHTFQVLVSSSTVGDDRTASTQVSVLRQSNSSQTVAVINSAPTRVNAGDALTLSGLLQAPYDVEAEWVVFVDGEEVETDTLTPILSAFGSNIVEGVVQFPLSIPGGVLVPGSIVTFRLVAAQAEAATDDDSAVANSTALTSGRRTLQQQVDSSSRTAAYSEITIVINSPPSGGSFSVSPPSGEGLVTPFRFLAVGWTDDAQDLPLSYRFAYQLKSSEPELEVGALSVSNTLVTDLPAGFGSFDFDVTVIAEIFDLALASTTSSSVVTVATPVNIDAQAYLDAKLNEALASGNIDVAVSGVNNLASTINTVDCSQANASFCGSLNRDVCFDTSNTCSECLERVLR